MGKILKPRGLKGELRVSIFNNENSTLKVGAEIWLKKNENDYFSLNIETISIAGGKSFIKFSEFDKWDSVKQFSGLRFFFPRGMFAPLKRKEFYLVDLIGCLVLDESRESIGSVVDTLTLPAQNVLVVEANKGSEILIPCVDAHISLFDENDKILIVKNVEGLLN